MDDSWDFLGRDAGALLKAAFHLRQAQLMAEKAMRSGDIHWIQRSLLALREANQAAQEAEAAMRKEN